MPFVPFYHFFAELAERETRTVTVLDGSDWNLPPAAYSLLEMYCDEPGCDCRRVFFLVVSSAHSEPIAVIGYGWEEPEYYAKWLGTDDPEHLREMRGPALNLLSPQSDLAPLVLRLIQDTVLEDQVYLNRLKAHYWMVRHHIDGKTAAQRDKADNERRERTRRAKLKAARKRKNTGRKTKRTRT